MTTKEAIMSSGDDVRNVFLEIAGPRPSEHPWP